MNNSKCRTPIVYYGGKSSLLSHITPLIPPPNDREVYTEAFFGGGAVFWSIPKSKNETINDRLDIVVNFYEQIKTNYHELKKLVDSTLVSRTQHKRAMAYLRKHSKSTPVQKAWAFWVTTNFSFTNKIGGGIKYSNKQNTVVPEQMKNKKKRFTEWLMHRIEDAHIENSDALVVLQSRNVKGAFHYLDPPYFNADMGHYGGYTEKDLEQLLLWCEGCKGKFLLSNYNSDLLNEFIRRNGWNKIEVTKRLQAPLIKVKDKTEVLVFNYTKSDLKPNLFNQTIIV